MTDAIAEQVRDWARRRLDPDTHCDPSIGEAYRVNTLYLDTPRFEVYHRERPVGRRKYRLRRYGSEGTIWLETKRKSKGLVRKRRTAVPELDLPLPEVPPDDKWHGDWFRRRVETRQLRPVSVVTYERFARIGSMPDGDVRLTIDRDLRGTSALGWQVPRDSAGEIELPPDRSVLGVEVPRRRARSVQAAAMRTAVAASLVFQIQNRDGWLWPPASAGRSRILILSWPTRPMSAADASRVRDGFSRSTLFMPDWLRQTFDGPEISLATLATRLAAALLSGFVVAWISRWSRPAPSTNDSLPTTLVLLCVLIAMVTQVIGENIARAFSLVGALSIVRFRTMVQDTRDTAFVLFAVIVGMSIGAGQPFVALLGMATFSLAALASSVTPLARASRPPTSIMTIRVGLSVNPQTLLADVFAKHLEHHQFVAAETVRQGSSLMLTYRVRLRTGIEPVAFVTDLNRLEGIESIVWS